MKSFGDTKNLIFMVLKNNLLALPDKTRFLSLNSEILCLLVFLARQ